MRKMLLILALVLLAGGFIAWQMQQDSGYVLIAFGSYSIDMSIWTALLLMLLAAVLWRGLKALWRMARTPGKGLFQNWFSSRERGRAQTAQGLLQFVEGRWGQSVRTLKKSIRRSELPLVNCVTAAYAALELGDYDQVRKLLVRAEQLAGSNMLSVDLMRGRLLLAEEYYEEALALLTRLHKSQPDHIPLLRMLVQAYQGLSDWESIEKMLADLRRYRALPAEQLLALEVDVYIRLLRARAEEQSDDATHKLIALWQEMPSIVRRSRQVMDAYVECLQQVGESDRAEQLLRKILKSEWDDGLVRRFGLLKGSDPVAQLETAESWLKAHGDSAELQLALGRLCQRNELWGKARDYFEAAVAIEPRAEIYGELARLTAQLGDQEKSTIYYQKGMQAGRQAS